MTKFALIAATLLASTAAVPAAAAPIIYQLTGTFTGSAGGSPFTDEPGVFTAVGDTDTLFTTADGSRNVVLSSLSVRALNNGNVFSFIGATPTSLRFGTNGGYAGFIVETDGNNPSVFFNTGLSGYNGVTNVASTSVNYVVSNGTFATLLNGTTPTTLTITSQNNLQFSANVQAVPEPATWGMMMLGMGMVGFGLRRRAGKVSTRVTFA